MVAEIDNAKPASPAATSISSTEKLDTNVVTVDSETGIDPDFLPRSGPRSLFVDGIKVHVDPNAPALAEGDIEARWSWLDLFRTKKTVENWNAIATRPSVYDDVILRPHYQPIPQYENIHRLDHNARWTYAEERRIVQKADLRVMLWVIFMFVMPKLLGLHCSIS
ncbi:hypothetical protein DL93DRAFT_2226556 [Clavulina sp. PMI_390]|nr:hypothetical protein DL93DRAFT_2226556 [Clavulina sp. PMI_390]